MSLQPPSVPADTDIAALLGSRICHDLISPLGAIGNGVELLTLSGGDFGPEIALIADSVTNASARIRFFRIAFGTASAQQTVSAAEVRAVLADLAQGGRIAFDWLPEAIVPRIEVKTLFLLILCLECALPAGGRIAVSAGAGEWTLTAEGPRLRVEPGLWDGLAGAAGLPDVTPATIQFALAAPELARLGRRLSVDVDEAGSPPTITLRF